MRFAQQLPAPDSAAVRKRTSACSETSFPIQCVIALVWANSFPQPRMQDHLHLGSYACCEEFLRKRQNQRDCSFFPCEQNAASVMDRTTQELMLEQMCPSRRH